MAKNSDFSKSRPGLGILECAFFSSGDMISVNRFKKAVNPAQTNAHVVSENSVFVVARSHVHHMCSCAFKSSFFFSLCPCRKKKYRQRGALSVCSMW